MNIELGILKLKYNGKSISWKSSYQKFCNFFADKDKYYYNGMDDSIVEATSKIIIADAFHSMRIPLNKSGFIQIIWTGSLKEPSSINIVHNAELNKNKPQYSYQELLAQIKTGKVVLPVKQTAPTRLSCRDGITLSALTAFSDLYQLALFYDTMLLKPSKSYSCHYEIIFDGVPCGVWCRFDEDNELRSISFEPIYANESDFTCDTPVENALVCQKRLLEMWGEPDMSDGSVDSGFYMIYDFDHCQVSNAIEYVSSDNIPIWSGLEIEFKQQIKEQNK